jgi:hypothetical protein
MQTHLSRNKFLKKGKMLKRRNVQKIEGKEPEGGRIKDRELKEEGYFA